MKKPMKNHRAGFTLIEFIAALVIAGIIAAMVYSYFGTALTQSGVPIARLQQASNLHKVMENIVADYNRLNALNLRFRWQPSTPYGLNSVVTPKTIPPSPDGGHYYICTTAGTSGATEPTWPTSGTVTDGGVVIWQESGDIVWQKSHLYTAGTIVVPINNTGHYYKSTAGTSGATEPTWPTSGMVTDGGVTWTEAGTVLEIADITDNLRNNLTTATDPPRYGTGYTLTENKFIQFNGSPPVEVNAGDSGTSSEKNILKVTIKNNNSAETLTQLFTIR